MKARYAVLGCWTSINVWPDVSLEGTKAEIYILFVWGKKTLKSVLKNTAAHGLAFLTHFI